MLAGDVEFHRVGEEDEEKVVERELRGKALVESKCHSERVDVPCKADVAVAEEDIRDWAAAGLQFGDKKGCKVSEGALECVGGDLDPSVKIKEGREGSRDHGRLARPGAEVDEALDRPELAEFSRFSGASYRATQGSGSRSFHDCSNGPPRRSGAWHCNIS